MMLFVKMEDILEQIVCTTLLKATRNGTADNTKAVENNPKI